MFWTLTEDGADGESDGLQVSMIVVLLLLQVEPSSTNLLLLRYKCALCISLFISCLPFPLMVEVEMGVYAPTQLRASLSTSVKYLEVAPKLVVLQNPVGKHKHKADSSPHSEILIE